MRKEIVNPKLQLPDGALTYFHPSHVTIQTQGAGSDEMNQPNGPWADVAGLTMLDCTLSAKGGREVPNSDGTYSISTHQIGFLTYYPAIMVKQRAVIDGVIYNIQVIEHDQLHTRTVLTVEIVK